MPTNIGPTATTTGWGVGGGGSGGGVGPRILQGTINGDGTVYAGTGFTCVRQALGKYRIDFTQPFAGPIIPHLDDISDSVAAGKHVSAAGGIASWNNGTNLQVWVSNATSGAYYDGPFTFTVIDGAANSLVANTTPWIPLVLTGGASSASWTSGGWNPPSYYKDHTGRVWLRGMITTPNAAPAGQVIANLPVGFRPAYNEQLDADAQNTQGTVTVTPSGQIQFGAGVGNGWFTLDGLSFMVADGPYALSSTGGGLGGTAKGTIPWITPTLLNGWTAYGGFETPGFYKDVTGRVHLRGLMKNGSSTAFVLPVGFRPNGTQLFSQVSGSSMARVDVNTPNGEVAVVGYDTGGGNGYVSLDGISFMAADGPYLGEVAQERIVRGTVNEDGSIYRGSGFTVTRVQVGVYTVTLTPPFGSPVVAFAQAVAQSTGQNSDVFTSDPAADGSSFSVYSLQNGSTYVDRRFSFEVKAVTPVAALPTAVAPWKRAINLQGNGTNTWPTANVTIPETGTYMISLGGTSHQSQAGLGALYLRWDGNDLSGGLDGATPAWNGGWCQTIIYHNTVGEHRTYPTFSDRYVLTAGTHSVSIRNVAAAATDNSGFAMVAIERCS